MTYLASDPLELVYRGDDKTVAYACPKCGQLFVPSGEDHHAASESAAAHCVPQACGCGAVLAANRAVCELCAEVARIDEDRKKFDLAKKISSEDYTEPVFWEGHEGSMGDGYFSSTEEVRDECESEGLVLPPYVWACTPRDLRISIDNILEDAFQDHYEGARDSLQDGAEEELEKYIKAWCKKQGIQSWVVDYKRAVLFSV